MLRAAALAWLLACATLPAVAAQIVMIDGDTFRLDGETIRLWGVDAPERGQECQRGGRATFPGPEAASALKTLLSRPGLACEATAKDRYGRTVARCTAGRRDVAGELVRQGWARDWPRYSAGAYAGQQAEARTGRRGMWRAGLVCPGEREQRHGQHH